MSIALLLMIKDEFNSAKNIIKSVEGICDEKVIVITGDKKVKESGECKILYFPWCDDYSAPLNAGLRLITSKWVLRLDSDEEIDEINLKRVQKAVSLRDDVSAYEVSQRGYLPRNRREFGVKSVPEYKGYTNAVDDGCIRLFRNDPRVFFEFNTHETLYNSLRRAKLKYVKSNIVIHHWGKLNMKNKAPYYYKLAKDRLRRYPEEYQSYYYVGVSAEFIGKLEESYEALKAGYEKYKTEYYRIPMEFIKEKRRNLNGRFN
jgi:glycosyltransferase involved in cell wall biosynthesis